MASPQFIQEKAVSLADVQDALANIEARDKELNYLSGRAKEYLPNINILSTAQKKELQQKLAALSLTRLKEEHFMKIVDFLPGTTEELKVVLQAYPLSMPKKDQDAIVAVVKEFKK